MQESVKSATSKRDEQLTTLWAILPSRACFGIELSLRSISLQHPFIFSKSQTRFPKESIQSFSFLLLDITFVHIFSLFSSTLVNLVNYRRLKIDQIFDDSIIYIELCTKLITNG